MLEAAACALLRELAEEPSCSFDGFTLTAGNRDGTTVLELAYTAAGRPLAGESL